MTRTKLLATTAAILMPMTSAFAQDAQSDDNMSSGATGSAEITAESETNAGTSNKLTESISETTEQTAEDVGDTAERVGDAAASTAEEALEETSEAASDAADAVTPDADATAEAQRQGGTITVGDVTGKPVIDATGEEIGEIDRVVSVENGTSAVIGVGGFLGIGERDVAIPMGEFRMNAEGQLELAGYTSEDLGRLPEFQENGARILEPDASIPDIG